MGVLFSSCSASCYRMPAHKSRVPCSKGAKVHCHLVFAIAFGGQPGQKAGFALAFPSIAKGGFIVGCQYEEGVFFVCSAFFFAQERLMAGLGLRGIKITRLNK